MSSGLDLAYEQAWESFKEGAENRVVVLSDGDANIGNTNWEDMLEQIQSYADKGVTMSTIGLGMGNYKDNNMEQLANKGDGNNFYVDSLEEANKIFVEGFSSTLITIARDVKIQVEFNFDVVASYRLIGYENREIADEDFRNDRVDAGEVGSGHSVTALYQLQLQPNILSGEIATTRLRYEHPGADKAAKERVFSFDVAEIDEERSSGMALGYAVSLFAEHLRNSPYKGDFALQDIYDYAQAHIDKNVRNEEFLSLIARAQELQR